MATFRRRILERLLLPWARLVLRCRRPLIIGITGSVGKTGTKEMLSALLATEEAVGRYGVAWTTPENLNTTAGVAFSVLGVPRYPRSWEELLVVPFRALTLAFFRGYPRVLVLEYAAGSKGNVAVTARLAPPDVAIVTAIGPSHLEVFESEEGVARAKAPLVRHARKTGLVILGEDNPFLDWMEQQASSPVVRARGRGRTLAAEITRIVGQRLDLSVETVESVIRDSSTLPRRLDVQEARGATLIDDTYSANPLSMRFALDTLEEIAGDGRRKVAVLGTMAELGPRSRDYHVEIGKYASERADLVIGVGDAARGYEPDIWCEDSDQGFMGLQSVAAAGDVILVKGSHSMRMHTIVRRFTADRTNVPDAHPGLSVLNTHVQHDTVSTTRPTRS